MTTDRIEQAAPDMREVLELAFFDIYGREPDKVHIPEWNQWRDREIRFTRFLDAEAYTDAALMLVPDRYKDDYILTSSAAYLGPDPMYYSEGEAQHIGYAETLALAIASASLRAKGPGHE